MPGLKDAISIMKANFKESSERIKGEDTLKKEGFSKLLKAEVPWPGDNDQVNKVFSNLDENKNDHLDLVEFVKILAELYKNCPEIFTEQSSSLSGSETWSYLWEAMKTFYNAFNHHAAKEENKTTLNKAEVVKLLKEEFLPEENITKTDADYFFSDMDKDKDGVVDFIEFVGFAAEISVIL